MAAPDPLRGRLRQQAHWDTETCATAASLRALAHRIQLLNSEAAEHTRAMLGGAAPIPASSGQTVRVRLNRSGDRQLNQALHLVVLTRLRSDPATRAYAQRRRAQGKTNREIKRCLVRYVARQLFRVLEHQAGSRFVV